MREILFRGKMYNGEWIEGDLINTVRNEDERFRDAVMILGLEYERIGEYGAIRKPEFVRPATLGQYTGLKDKNGKRIFEGDIVRHHNESPYADSDNIELGKVYWDEKTCGWRRTSNGAFHHGCVDTYRMSPDCVYEVIGNIHDNPELFGGA